MENGNKNYMKQLAIVIPAYKIDFFRATLDSLAAQTCKDFTVYVGDDCSPSDFGRLIEEYKDRLDIKYTKFESNLGGKDLVAQWTRCIDLTKGEPWLWLFSDDDVMGERCVEAFYKEIEGGAKFDIYHFNVDIINEYNTIIKTPLSYPLLISSMDFFIQKESAKISSFVVEYVFSRNAFNQVGGFQNFDMAWGTDIATWVKLGMNKGIKTIKECKVMWRFSSQNITPKMDSIMAAKKVTANIEYIDWSNGYFNNNVIRRFNIYHFFRLMVFYSLTLRNNDRKNLISQAINKNIIPSWFGFLLRYCFMFLVIAKYVKQNFLTRVNITTI